MQTVPHTTNDSAMPAPSSLWIEVGPPPPRTGLQWRRAIRALRELLDEPDKTEKAFEVFYAIDGDREEREFQRFIAHPDGRRLLRERRSLLDLLSDRKTLAQMAEGSLGRAYLSYIDANGFEPGGLINLKNSMRDGYLAAGEIGAPLDEAREWFRDRCMLMHDLFHVLTGYGTDEMGEGGLLPFTWAQSGGRANGLLVFGAMLRGTMTYGLSVPRYFAQAWRRGRRATWLALLPYEELLPEQLERVRRLGGIEPAEVAHPGGIWRGAFSSGRAALG